MQLISSEKGWKHVSMQKVVTLNTCCDIPVATHHNQFFSEPPTFGEMQHYFKSDEIFFAFYKVRQ